MPESKESVGAGQHGVTISTLLMAGTEKDNNTSASYLRGLLKFTEFINNVKNARSKRKKILADLIHLPKNSPQK